MLCLPSTICSLSMTWWWCRRRSFTTCWIKRKFEILNDNKKLVEVIVAWTNSCICLWIYYELHNKAIKSMTNKVFMYIFISIGLYEALGNQRRGIDSLSYWYRFRTKRTTIGSFMRVFVNKVYADIEMTITSLIGNIKWLYLQRFKN